MEQILQFLFHFFFFFLTLRQFSCSLYNLINLSSVILLNRPPCKFHRDRQNIIHVNKMVILTLDDFSWFSIVLKNCSIFNKFRFNKSWSINTGKINIASKLMQSVTSTNFRNSVSILFKYDELWCYVCIIYSVYL